MRFLQIVQQQAAVSRRRARALIEAGRVRLNGTVTATPFAEVAAEQIRTLEVDGRPIQVARPTLGAYKYYKPSGMLCSFADPHHHYAMGKVLRRPELRGYKIVGRLDRDAEGLLLLTNDGALLNRLAHPRYQVEKEYHVLVPRVLRYRQTFDAFRQMKSGIQDAGETLSIVRGEVVRRTDDSTLLMLVLTEGRNHEVKRLCKRYGWAVQRLVRVAMGGVRLGGLRSGDLRPLSTSELKQLQDILADAPA